MQSVTAVYRHPDGFMQSLGSAFGDHPGLEPIALYAGRLLDDGTALMLYEVAGSADAVRRVLEENDQAREYRVTQVSDSVSALIHFTPTETVRALMALPEEYGLVLDTPIAVRPDGRLEVTVVGLQENISAAFEEIPAPLESSVERVGRYEPGGGSFLETLSDRQLEVFLLAYERGYYENPREATHDDIAAELSCSAANVGEILRRIEHHLVDRALSNAPPSVTNRHQGL